MSPEPQDVLTADIKRTLGMWYAQHPPVFTEDRIGCVATAEAVSIMRDYCRRAQARAIAQDAESHEILSVTNLPMQEGQDRKLKQMVRGAMGHISGQQMSQLAWWRRSGGATRAQSLGLVAVWHVPADWERVMSDTQIEGLAQAWLMPLVADAISIPRFCFSHTLASWVVAQDVVNQGITIALLRED